MSELALRAGIISAILLVASLVGLTPRPAAGNDRALPTFTIPPSACLENYQFIGPGEVAGFF